MESPGWSKQSSPANESSDLASTRKVVSACQLHGRSAQHRNNSSFPSSPHPEVTQLGLSLYVSGASTVTVPELEPRVSACE